jgi:CelD/BcsL family acetyltransferase involved in cellulose biosynthesis
MKTENVNRFDAAGRHYKLTTLWGEAAFYELKEEWENLWTQSVDATQVQRWEWQYFYFKHMVPRGNPIIIVVHDTIGSCAALAAFCPVVDVDSGLKKIAFLGDSYADYHMILCLPNLPYYIGFQIFDFLFNFSRQQGSFLDLSNIPQGTWTEIVLSAYLLTNHFSTDLLFPRRTQTYSVPLPSDMGTYLTRLGAASRRNITRDRRRLEKDFFVKVQAFEGLADLEHCLKAIELIDRARWKQESRYCDPSWRSLLITLTQAQICSGIYLSFVLFLQDKPAAYVTGVVVRNSYITVSAAYDPELPRQLSVGKTIHFYAIEECLRRGFTHYDLARGSESYKIWLGAEPHNNFHVRLYRSPLDRGLDVVGKRILEFIKRQTWLRRLYQRFIRGVVR